MDRQRLSAGSRPLKRPGRGSDRAGGFTLIEMLVVIAIISVVVGILLPTLSTARERGRTAECLSNLRQFGIAAESFSTDRDGELLRSAYPVNLRDRVLPAYVLNQSWVFTLRDYNMDMHRYGRCPSDASPYFETRSPITDRYRDVSYGTNSWTSSAVRHQRMIYQATHTIMAGELVENGSGFATSDHFEEPCWKPGECCCRPDYPGQIEVKRHDKRPNWLFHDGHVAGHVLDELHVWEKEGSTVRWTRNWFRPQPPAGEESVDD